jgi:DNA-binding transcriptional ArsR family regulator
MPEQLDAIFAALSDGTRRTMLDRLRGGELSAGELAAPHAISLTAVMKHVGVLERAGLVRREKRGRTVWCRLDPQALQAGAEWIERYRTFWSARVDDLAAHLAARRH